MAKRDKYLEGRKDGLLLALSIVKKGGVDALQEEIEFRNITGFNLSMSKAEALEAATKIKENTFKYMTLLSIAVLHDEFGFGRKRLQRFSDRFDLKSDCLLDQNNVTWEDYAKVIKKETGIDITVIDQD